MLTSLRWPTSEKLQIKKLVQLLQIKKVAANLNVQNELLQIKRMLLQKYRKCTCSLKEGGVDTRSLIFLELEAVVLFSWPV